MHPIARALVLLVVTVVLGGCANSYSGLSDESLFAQIATIAEANTDLAQSMEAEITAYVPTNEAAARRREDIERQCASLMAMTREIESSASLAVQQGDHAALVATRRRAETAEKKAEALLKEWRSIAR